MTIVVAVLAFAAGGAIGAGLAIWWMNRGPVKDALLPDAGPAAQPSGEALAATSEEGDADLKPILEATRGVLSDLEERYRGRRSGKADG